MNYFRDFKNSKTILAGAPGLGYALGVGVQDPNVWAATEFRFLVSDVPVLDYGSITDRIGSIDLMTPVKIDLPPYAKIRVECGNNSGTDTLFAARLQCKAL